MIICQIMNKYEYHLRIVLFYNISIFVGIVSKQDIYV